MGAHGRQRSPAWVDRHGVFERGGLRCGIASVPATSPEFAFTVADERKERALTQTWWPAVETLDIESSPTHTCRGGHGDQSGRDDRGRIDGRSARHDGLRAGAHGKGGAADAQSPMERTAVRDHEFTARVRCELSRERLRYARSSHRTTAATKPNDGVRRTGTGVRAISSRWEGPCFQLASGAPGPRNRCAPCDAELRGRMKSGGGGSIAMRSLSGSGVKRLPFLRGLSLSVPLGDG